jgi:serine/threonine protein kinase
VPESVLSTLLFDVLGVVQQLHAAGLIHNDIDLRSFLLSPSNFQLKITNFSFSFFPAFTPGGSLDSSSDFRWQAPSSRFFGPLRHQSPERLLGLRCALRTK